MVKLNNDDLLKVRKLFHDQWHEFNETHKKYKYVSNFVTWAIHHFAKTEIRLIQLEKEIEKLTKERECNTKS